MMSDASIEKKRSGFTVASEERPVRFDRGRYPRARIGFVLIPNEQTIEWDMVRHMPEGVGAFFSRAPMPPEISAGSLASIRSELAAAAGRILPHDGLDVVCFACTSGTIAVGEEATLAELRRGAPDAIATSLAGGVRKALRAVGANRIAVCTPYTDELNDVVARYLEECGFTIVSFQGMGLSYDRDMIRVAPDFILDTARRVDRAEADAVLVSCGALRTLDVVERIESTLDKPVVCSNQAMLWDCLRLAGIEDRIDGLGRLLREF